MEGLTTMVVKIPFALITLSSSLSMVAANCAHGTSLFPRLPNVTVSAFSYTGLSGPLNWLGLNEIANKACDIGTQQSPIVLNGSIPQIPGTSIIFVPQDYPNGAKFENLGTNLEVVVNGSMVDLVTGTNYSLAQFHFHTPAEHRVEEEFFAMEMHWVFESAGE
jgi:carbonic anhydrase